MKNITGKYHVADCEHCGDMDCARSMIAGLGCIITDSYWDGRDCGEAWVEFSFPECRFVAIYNKLGSSAVYSDLYLSSDGSFIPVLKDGVNRSYNLKDHRFWDWKKPQYRSIIVECRGK